MTAFPYDLTGPIGAKTLGLLVLQMDETIEQDFRRLFPSPEVAIYTSRLPSGASVTPETLAAMKGELPRAASLFPPAARFDAVGYACTSGTTQIGAGKVAELVSGACSTRAVTNPMTAALAACDHLGVQRIGIVSPYIPSVAEPIRQSFAAHGIDTVATLSFGEEVEERVARIAPASIRAAAKSLFDQAPMDAIFLSCTNLRTLDVIGDLEQDLGIPVLSSNLCLAWHMAQLSGTAIEADANSILNS